MMKQFWCREFIAESTEYYGIGISDITEYYGRGLRAGIYYGILRNWNFQILWNTTEYYGP